MSSPDPATMHVTLPRQLESLFWDCEFHTLSFEEYPSFIIRRVLDRGDWEAISWLRETAGDEKIREWFLQKQGGKLDPRKLRFWGLILDIPESEVDHWVSEARQSTWYGRMER